MAWWNFLFASKKTTEDITATGKKIAGGIVDGIDALILTEEERIGYGQKGAEIILNFWKTIAGENTEQSRARRELAKMIIKAFIVMLFLAITCRILAIPFGKEWTEAANFILKIALSGIVGGLVISIGTIYFGPHQLSKIVDFKKD